MHATKNAVQNDLQQLEDKKLQEVDLKQFQTVSSSVDKIQSETEEAKSLKSTIEDEIQAMKTSKGDIQQELDQLMAKKSEVLTAIEKLEEERLRLEESIRDAQDRVEETRKNESQPMFAWGLEAKTMRGSTDVMSGHQEDGENTEQLETVSGSLLEQKIALENEIIALTSKKEIRQ